MPDFSFSIAGVPVPQARPKLSRFRTYDPKYKEKQLTRAILKTQWGTRSPLTGKVSITLSFMMPVPKSMSKKKRVELIETKAAHIIKPDLDNLIKFILDCMNSIVLFDDSLVSDIKATKSYAGFAETLITVSVA